MQTIPEYSANEPQDADGSLIRFPKRKRGGFSPSRPALTVSGRKTHSAAMTISATATPPEPVLFDAHLRPHRSLSPAGFRVLMAASAAALLGVGAVFFAAGAWPVIGFCGLEFVLVYLFFRLNFRDLRRCETIRLTAHELEIRRIAPDGAVVERVSLQPYWVRVAIENAPGRANRLVLSSHGRTMAVGSFLTPEEREDLARALVDALACQRRAPGVQGLERSAP
jgi:uncharacterized membrane protein